LGCGKWITMSIIAVGVERTVGRNCDGVGLIIVDKTEEVLTWKDNVK
jgi:hypothetical protein